MKPNYQPLRERRVERGAKREARKSLNAPHSHAPRSHAPRSTLLAFSALLILFLSLVSTSLGAEQHTTLAIKPDGSCVLTIDKIEPRMLVEQQVRMWERVQSMRDNADEEPKPAAPTETKPLTDDELAKKIRETRQVQAEQLEEDSAEKIETLEIKTNTVHTVTTRNFAGLDEMLQRAYVIWAQAGLSFENVKFEKDADQQLRVTLTPPAAAQRYTKSLRQQWKLTGAINEIKLVLPGKVLTSGLPNHEGNQTWLVIDGQKTESVDAALKLHDAPVIITAELGGLKLDQPLESRTLQRFGQRRSGSPDLPITDAGPGFVAEPIAVTTTTLYYFPGAEKYAQQARAASFGRNQTGAVVRAKLFAPKGRTLQSVSGVRVLKATDDKGRSLAGAQTESVDAEMSEGSEMIVYHSGAAQGGNSTQISLRLQLPPPDAQSIDELSAEAIALTAGHWKEMTLTNITSHTTNEVDLADVLTGAKMVITKFTAKNRQLNLQARLTGPPSIRQIEVVLKTTGRQRSTANAYERNFTTHQGRSTRNLQLQHYGVSEENDANSTGPLLLVVRYPEDQRRERVKFTLKALDLF